MKTAIELWNEQMKPYIPIGLTIDEMESFFMECNLFVFPELNTIQHPSILMPVDIKKMIGLMKEVGAKSIQVSRLGLQEERKSFVLLGIYFYNGKIKYEAL